MNYDSVPLRDFKEIDNWDTVMFVYHSALKQIETKIDINITLSSMSNPGSKLRKALSKSLNAIITNPAQKI